MAASAHLRKSRARRRRRAFRSARGVARRRPLHRPGIRACRLRLGGHPGPAEPVGIPPARPPSPPVLRAVPAQLSGAGPLYPPLRGSRAGLALLLEVADGPLAVALLEARLRALALARM